MELTEEQFSRIAHVLPRQRGNVRISNFQLLNALLYVAGNGCKWRALPAALRQVAGLHADDALEQGRRVREGVCRVAAQATAAGAYRVPQSGFDHCQWYIPTAQVR